MEVQGKHVEETPQEARQGQNVKGMTTVLRVSFGLAVLGMAIVALFFVLGR